MQLNFSIMKSGCETRHLNFCTAPAQPRNLNDGGFCSCFFFHPNPREVPDPSSSKLMSFTNKIEGAAVPQQQHPYTTSPHSSSNQINQLDQNNHISEPLSTSTTASTSKESPIEHPHKKVTLDEPHLVRDEFKGPSRRGTRDSAASGGGFDRPPLMKRLTSLMKSERHIKREPSYKVR